MTDTEKLSKYVDRLMNDDEVKGRLKKSASAGGAALRRTRKKGARKAARDATARRQAVKAVVAARTAIQKLNEPEKKPKSRWLKRFVFLSLIGAGVYLAVNEEAREQVKDLFGPDGDESVNSAGSMDYPRPENVSESGQD